MVGASAGMASMATTWPAVGRSAGFSRRHASTADRTGSARPASSGPAAPAIGGRPVAANTSTPPNAKTSPASAAGAVEAAVSSGATYPGVPYPGPAAAGEAEPDQARALLGEHDRRRREVAVREAARVHGGEPGRQPLGQRRRARITQRAALVDELLQRGARDVHLGPPRRIGRGVDVHDGRHEPQRGRGGGTGLRGEPLPEPGARRDGRVHEREHDGAAGRVRAEQRATDRAVREQPHDLVRPERGGVVRRAHGYSSIREPMTTVRSTGRQK